MNINLERFAEKHEALAIDPGLADSQFNLDLDEQTKVLYHFQDKVSSLVVLKMPVEFIVFPINYLGYDYPGYEVVGDMSRLVAEEFISYAGEVEADLKHAFRRLGSAKLKELIANETVTWKELADFYWRAWNK